jgi:hypothetical protein
MNVGLSIGIDQIMKAPPVDCDIDGEVQLVYVASAVEKLAAAVWLDSGLSTEALKAFIENKMLPMAPDLGINELKVHRKLMQRLSHQAFGEPVDVVTIRTHGTFTCRLTLPNGFQFRRDGTNEKETLLILCHAAIEHLEKLLSRES